MNLYSRSLINLLRLNYQLTIKPQTTCTPYTRDSIYFPFKQRQVTKSKLYKKKEICLQSNFNCCRAQWLGMGKMLTPGEKTSALQSLWPTSHIVFRGLWASVPHAHTLVFKLITSFGRNVIAKEKKCHDHHQHFFVNGVCTIRGMWCQIWNMYKPQCHLKIFTLHVLQNDKQTDRVGMDRHLWYIQDQTWMDGRTDGLVVYCLCRRPFNAVDET